MRQTFTHRAYPLPIDTQQVARDWAAEGFSCGTFRDPPGQEWNDFVHDCDEYVLVVQGRLQIDVGPEQSTATPGDLVRIPKGIRHSLKTLSAEGSVWLYGYGTWGEGHG